MEVSRETRTDNRVDAGERVCSSPARSSSSLTGVMTACTRATFTSGGRSPIQSRQNLPHIPFPHIKPEPIAHCLVLVLGVQVQACLRNKLGLHRACACKKSGEPRILVAPLFYCRVMFRPVVGAVMLGVKVDCAL